MSMKSNNVEPAPPVARWEWALVAAMMLTAITLGFSNLSTPSLWHDELVHVYVGKSIAETGLAALPSGTPYHNGTTQNHIIATMIRTVGLTEWSVRFPSVIFAGLNVLLTFLLLGPLLGTRTALIAALGLAVSPWSVAWSREARFYTLQQTLYLATMFGFWKGTQSATRTKAIPWFVLTVVAYALAILTSYHPILFLGSIGAFAIIMCIVTRTWRSRYSASVAAISIAGLITLDSFSLLMNSVDRTAVYTGGGLGGAMTDVLRSDRNYYFAWLRLNLSSGFFILFLHGLHTSPHATQS